MTDQSAIEVIARELSREAWRYKTCKPGSEDDRRRAKSLVKAARVWDALRKAGFLKGWKPE